MSNSEIIIDNFINSISQIVNNFGEIKTKNVLSLISDKIHVFSKDESFKDVESECYRLLLKQEAILIQEVKQQSLF